MYDLDIKIYTLPFEPATHAVLVSVHTWSLPGRPKFTLSVASCLGVCPRGLDFLALTAVPPRCHASPSPISGAICSRNALGALVASVSQALPPWVGARGNGFYGIDPLNTSLRKYGQQALLRRPTVFNGNIGNKDQSKEENNKRKKNPATQ